MSSPDILVIDTPALPVECTPVGLQWSGGTPPYTLTIASFKTILEQHAGLVDTSFTWTPNVTAGTPVMLFLLDHANLKAESQLFLIQQGTDDSCITTAPAASATTQPAAFPSAGLSTGVLAGIGVAASLFVMISTAVLLVWVRRRRRRVAEPREERTVELREEPPLAPTFLLPSSKARQAVRERPSPEDGALEESPTSADSMSVQVETSALGDAGVAGGSASHDDTSVFPRPLAPRPRTFADKRRLPLSVIHAVPSSSRLQGRDAVHVRARPLPQIPRHASDGGVRLAGGPLDERNEEESSTLPPPYRRY
ncbi:hypothetical protein C2E23DRAFT_565037 [Lenzites betulinus]|nr:hypothetical protein C2E23DRAFT_565037 [Lenzites betulinus]